MTGTQTLLARTALGVAGAAATIVLTRWRRPFELSSQRFDCCVVAAFVLSRMGLFTAVFLVMHLAPRGDIPTYYFPQAESVLHHLLPYRDFPSSYAPLHPYLDAIFISVRRSPTAIIFASIALECLMIPCWLRLGRGFLDERVVRTASLLYLASPISLQFVTVDGQDNVVIALLLALALLFALRSRALLSGVSLGVSAVTIKFLPLLFAPVFFGVLLRRVRWAAGLGIVLAAVYGGALLLHLPVLQPLTAEGAMRSAGNLPYLVEALIGYRIPARATDVTLLVLLGLLFAWIAKSASQLSLPHRMRVVTFGLCAVTFVLLLFAKKSWPPYMMLTLFPTCVLVASDEERMDRGTALFACLSMAAVTEQSIWSSLLLEATSLQFRARLFIGEGSALLLLGSHAVLLSGYAWMLYLAGYRLKNLGQTPPSK